MNLGDYIKAHEQKMQANEIRLPCAYSELTREERARVREQYIVVQKGLCMYCEEPLGENPPKRVTDKPILWSMFPEGFLNYPVHLQHCHKTDMTQGAVHAYCNAVLWQYHDQ